MPKRFWFYVILLLLATAVYLTPYPALGPVSGVKQHRPLEQNLKQITLPPGFHIALFAGHVEGAREMTRGTDGTIFVGSRGTGNVYALRDDDGDFVAEKRYIVAKGLNSPNGVAFRDGALYVAEINRILRFDGIESRLDDPPRPVVISDAFPDEGHHGWKYIAFGPDGLLYVPVGAPCNVCRRGDERFGTIMRMRPDGSALEVYARGVRNSVGFDWQPDTGILYFTDNGRDMLGDDLPPDELNAAPEKGMHFGFPFCHGGIIPDPEFGKTSPCSAFTPPAVALGPHVAALGMRFYTGKQFPRQYRKQLFIAEHGSWNRSVPIGYRVTLVRFDAQRPLSYEVFAQGWLQGSSAWGRPVDLLQLPDGSMLLSDDRANVIYRISYTKRN